MDSVGYSKDLDALRDAVHSQQQMNQEIVDFQRDLEEFSLAKVSLSCSVFWILYYMWRWCIAYNTSNRTTCCLCAIVKLRRVDLLK